MRFMNERVSKHLRLHVKFSINFGPPDRFENGTILTKIPRPENDAQFELLSLKIDAQFFESNRFSKTKCIAKDQN